VSGQLLIPQVEWRGHQGALSRTLGEQIVQTEESFMATKKKAAKKKKH